MTLIELDLSEPQEPAVSAPPPVRAYRLPGLLLAVVLLFTLGAAVAPAPDAGWKRLGDIPFGVGSTFTLAGDRVYTASGAGDERTITAYAIGKSPRPLWSLPFPDKPDPDTGYVGPHPLVAYRTGEQVVLGDSDGWIVVDASAGTVRWRLSSLFTLLPGDGVGFVLHTTFRPGTAYDTESGDPGQLFFDENGKPHTEPPLVTEVRGLSVADGHQIWAYKAPGSVNAFAAPGEEPAVLVLASGGVARVDGRTGKVVRSVALSPIDGARPVYGSVIGDALMVDYLTTSGRGADPSGAVPGYEVAYDPAGLTVRWRRDVPAGFTENNCYQVLCDTETGTGKRVVLDVATGRPLLRILQTTVATAAGPYLLESDQDTGRPLRLADPGTGQIRLDLSAWATALVPSVRGDPAVVVRRYLGDSGTGFAAVDAGRNQLRPLGSTPDQVDDCTAETGVIACRAAGGLRVWSFHL